VLGVLASSGVDVKPLPPRPAGLKRENSARLMLRSVAKQVIAVNKEVRREEEEAAVRLQEIKDASMLDVAELGMCVSMTWEQGTYR
jgi:hypothetical protein